MQLGFPDLFPFFTAETYYQFVTMHGMIMVVYLLTALFLGGFGNYLIPLMVGSRDMVFPYANMLSFWMFFIAVVVLMSSFFVPGGPTGSGWTLYPPQAILEGTPGSGYGILLMLISIIIRNWFYYGWIKLRNHYFTSENKRNEFDENAFDNLGNFYSDSSCFTSFSSFTC
jgi:heme/copper-type cytochrome/quinol oxidase subunit 1